MSTTVLEALDNIAKETGANTEAVRLMVAHLSGVAPDAPDKARSDPREEIIVRYTAGTGQWAPDHKFNVLRMKMFKMDGTPDGTHDGVWEPQVDIDGMRVVPKPPKGPLDKPEGPVEHIPIRAYTKANWVFGDGSSIIAVGPACLHLVELSDGSNLFLVVVAAIVTGGTGRFQGCRGVKTALGSTFVPAGADLANPPGGKFGAVTVETFRIIRAANVK